MSQIIREEIKKGRDMVKHGHAEDSIKFFEGLVHKYPNVAEVNLYAGMTHDNLGQEQKALPLYEKALELGLSEKNERRNCLVSLASSYLVLGDRMKSLKAIEKAKGSFPNDPVVSSFYALTLCELNKTKQAVKELGLTLLKESENPNLKNFEEPLQKYFSELDV